MASREQLIRRMAKQRGLDPDAVIAIASVEGMAALRGGVSVGDNGTSFGPFQLHVGGALPAGRGSPWAHSRAGIAYALDGMAKVARGLSGQEAVAAISRRFERPADPAGEIAKAMGFYGKGGGGAGQAAGDFGGRGFQSAPTEPIPTQPDLGSVAFDNLSHIAAGTFSPEGSLAALSGAVADAQVSAPELQTHPMTPSIKIQGKASPTARKAAGLVFDYLGTPYHWGGESPGGFDCSGLLQYVWGKEGVQIPRTSQEQWQAGSAVKKSQLRPGDAVFFEPGKGGPGHVGMYVGGGRFIESPHTGASVRISKLAGRTDFVGARRFA